MKKDLLVRVVHEEGVEEATRTISTSRRGGYLRALMEPIHDAKCLTINGSGSCSCGASALYAKWVERTSKLLYG